MIQNRRSTLINFFGLVLGLTSFVVIFSWIRTEFSVDRFHTNNGQLFQLVIQFPDGPLDSNTPYALAPEMMNTFPEIRSYTRLVRMQTNMNSTFDFFPEDPDNEPVYENMVACVDTAFFHMFSFNPVHGIGQFRMERPDGVVLNRKLAEKYFGDENPVGKQILMNARVLLEVTGVVEIPDNTQFNYDLFLPLPETYHSSWSWRDPSFIMLHPGVDKQPFEDRLFTYFNETLPSELPGNHQLKLLPIEKANLAFGKRKEFLLFSFIAIMMLVIVAINYMNLSTANFSKRIREMGMRKIIGATPRFLRNQLFTETLIQTTAAMIVALFLAELLLPRLSDMFNTSVQIGYREQPMILAGLVLLIFLFSLLTVIYPVFVLTRGYPTEILRDSFIKGKSRSNVLLVTTILQFSISICLLISTMVVIRQVRYAKDIPTGLHVENVIKVPLNPQLGQQFYSFIDEIESHTAVLEVTAGQKNPINEDSKTNIDWEGRDPDNHPLVRYSICLPNFPAFFGHEIILGRLYSDTIRADLSRFLVNETACELLGRENPVGDRINFWGVEGEILGIFRNYHHISAHREILPHVVSINPINYRHLRFIFIRIAPEDQAETIAFIKDTFRKFSGDFPFTHEFLLEEVDQMYAGDVRLARIIGFFAFLALLISCLGIYGLARFSVEKKTRDLTIQRVYGASFRRIILLANMEMLKRTGIAVVVAIPLAFFMLERWLRSFAFRTDLSWWFFVMGGALGILISVAATMIGIRKALQQKPQEVLNQM